MNRRFITFVLFVVAIAIILLASGIVADHYIKKHLEANLVQNYSSEEQVIGNQFGSSILDRFASIQNSLTAIALDANIQSPNPKVCNPALKNYYSTLSIGVGNLGRVNNAGIFYCTITPSLLNKPASSLGTYVQQLFDDPQHHPVVSPEVTVPGVAGYVVALHVPVYNDQHQFLGSIGGAVYLNQLATDIFSKVKFAQTGYAAVQDDNGDIIYSHTAANIGKNYFSAALQNQSGGQLKPLNDAIYAARQGKSSSVSYVAQGVDKIAAVIPVTIVPNHRWIVVVTVPKSEIAATFVHAGINNAFNVVLALLSIILIVLLGVLTIITHNSYKLQLAKDQFISLVSHQLRTPLTAIRLFSEMLSDPKVGTLNAKQKDYVEKVHLSTVRMIGLVGDILNASRIDLDRLKVEPELTDLTAFVQSEVDEAQPLAAERQITLLAHLPERALELKVDQTLFGQVIHNLLTNAIRYSPEGHGRVRVTLRARKRGGCELIVSDNGIGIPKEDKTKIFERFYRAENAIRTVGDGTGLGLYLIKMILTVTGGKIWFKSTENKGTTFHVTIPASGMAASKRIMRK